ncbi:hypothetical protein EON65_49315 [archaeon]|nr:MAG: hypothetical protein EON65_49315 [archaeon]
MNIIITLLASLFLLVLGKGSFDEGKLAFDKRGRITQLDFAQESVQAYCSPSLIIRHNEDTLLLINRRREIYTDYSDTTSSSNVLLKGSCRWSTAPKLLWQVSPRLVILTIGYQSDCNYLGQFIREECAKYRAKFGHDVSANYLSNKCASFCHEHMEIARGLRPLAAHLVILNADEPGRLRLVSNSGALLVLQLQSLESVSSDASVFRSESPPPAATQPDESNKEDIRGGDTALLKCICDRLKARLLESSSRSLRQVLEDIRGKIPSDQIEVWLIDSKSSSKSLVKLI